MNPDHRTGAESTAARAGDPPPLHDEARRALREGRLEEAVALAESALQGERTGGPAPSGEAAAEALAVLGEAALRRQRPRDALPHLEESFRLSPRGYTASLIVRALYRSGEWEAGVARCRGFLRAHPGDLHLRRLEVRYHFEKQDFAAAEAALLGLLADHPDSAGDQALLVDARTRAAPPVERVRQLEALFKVESRRQDPQLRYLQGKNRLQAGDLPGACREFAEAVALDPGSRFYRSQLAFALKRAGRLNEALGLLRELFLADPSDVYVASAFQAACRAAGDRESLRGTLREALRLHPEMKSLYGLLRKAAREER